MGGSCCDADSSPWNVSSLYGADVRLEPFEHVLVPGENCGNAAILLNSGLSTWCFFKLPLSSMSSSVVLVVFMMRNFLASSRDVNFLKHAPVYPLVCLLQAFHSVKMPVCRPAATA